MKTLVVIDAQNDFITGSLGSKEGQNILPKIVEYVKNFDGSVFYTMDEHWDDDESKEIQKFGLHCVVDTIGRKIPQELEVELEKKDAQCFCKETFMVTHGYEEEDLDYGIYQVYNDYNVEDQENTVYLCGYCTDICVLNNALYLRSNLPNDKIVVLKDLCCGTSKEMHQKALDIMKVNLIEIQESK